MDERIGCWMMVGGGALMLLAYPLDWSTNGDASGDNPFHYPLTGGVAWLIVVAVGVIALMRMLRAAELTVVSPLATLVAGAVATGLMLIRVVIGGRTVTTGGTTTELDRGPGMWLALAASAIATTGAAIAWWGGVRGGRRSWPSARRPRSG